MFLCNTGDCVEMSQLASLIGFTVGVCIHSLLISGHGSKKGRRKNNKDADFEKKV